MGTPNSILLNGSSRN